MSKHLADWFVGYDKAHGVFQEQGRDERGKIKGKALTVNKPLSLDAWQKHLTATGPGIGVIALLEDNTVRWGTIDVDVYSLDLAELSKRIATLPLVLFQSKSTGAHLACFVTEPVPAQAMQDYLSALAAQLGHGGVEIFPKQSSRANERDIGNWINMPYYGETRPAWDAGAPIALDAALALIERRAIDAETFFALTDEVDRYAASKPPADSSPPASDEARPNGDTPKRRGPREADLTGDAFADGPPCLQLLAQRNGFGSGVRNEGMFNVAVYLRKKNPDGWKEDLIDYRTMCDPPMDIDELQKTVTKSVGRKEYSYRCNQQPIAPHCNRRLCLKRPYGVGEAATSSRAAQIGALTKYEGEPVLWVVDIDGKRMELKTEELLSQAAFARKCADTLTMLPASLPEARWRMYLNELMKGADIVPAPEDEETTEGHFWVLVERFCTQRAQGSNRDAVATNYPFTEGGTTYFRGAALIDFLNRAGFKIKESRDVWRMLQRREGAEKANWTIKGTVVNVWGITAFKTEDGSLRELPDLGGDGDEF